MRKARSDDDLVTHCPPRHAFAELDNLSDHVGADDMWQRNFAAYRTGADEGVVIVGADRAHPDEHIAGARP